MSYSPIALTIPQYDKTTLASWWLKAYEQGTVTPLSMATDATGGTLLAKCQLDSEGFPVTAGPARFIPFIDGDYDLWCFPTEFEADFDDTTNAIQFADNLNADPSKNSVIPIDNVVDLKLFEGEFDNQRVSLQSYYDGIVGGGQELFWDATSTETANDGTIFQVTGVVTGRWKSVEPADISFKKFGAKGDGTTDDTAFIQAACDYADNFYSGADQSNGLQSIPVNVGAGKFRITTTITYVGAGHWMMKGLDGRGSSLLWDGNSSIPAISCTNGSNFRFEDITTVVVSGATKPSAWIDIDLAIDIGFSLKGSAFGACEVAVECTGITNAYLNDWRVDDVNASVLRINATGSAAFYRNVIFDDFTSHNRAGSSVATSIVEIVNFQTSDSYNISFRNCRFEIEDDTAGFPAAPGIGADWSYVDLRATGALTSSPHIIVSFENTNAQYNGGGSGKDSNILKCTSATTDIKPVIEFRGAVFDDLTDFVNGDVDASFVQPTGSTYTNYQLTGSIGSGKFADLSLLRGSYDIANRVFIPASKDLTDSTNNDLFNIELPSNSQAGGSINWTVEATDGIDFQSLTSFTMWTCTNKATAKSATVTTNASNTSSNVTAGTLTATINIASSATGVKLRINPVSSLTTTSYKVFYTVTNNSDQIGLPL